jgi:hypothetical protein
VWGNSGSVNFLVLRPAGGTAFTVVYESPSRSLVGPGINTFPDSVDVLSGDRIAFEDNTTGLACFIGTGNAADTVGWNAQKVTPDSTVNTVGPPAGCNACLTGVRWNLGATVEPIGKDDCKHGGWKGWPVFKNQGDCVSFVATEGKNPPG